MLTEPLSRSTVFDFVSHRAPLRKGLWPWYGRYLIPYALHGLWEGQQIATWSAAVGDDSDDSLYEPDVARDLKVSMAHLHWCFTKWR